MDGLLLHIAPVYSQLHPTQHMGETLLHTHQVETLAAFRNADVDVILNVAITSDGKSTAAYLPAFQDGKHVVAMYPTNELIRDQLASLRLSEQRLAVQLPKYETMYSAKISELMCTHETTERLEAVRSLIRRHPILLTNPDLVHLMMSLQYGWGYRRKELPFELEMQYDYLLFDEFHVFDVPQVIAVTNMLGYLATAYEEQPEKRKKFVFLSATPSKLFDTLLMRGGLRIKSVKGYYKSTQERGYRCILQPCELELQEVSPELSVEQWVETHLEEIRTFFFTHKGSKGAILVNSVATAKRLVALLKAQLPELSIGENTGLTASQERTASYTKDILVGTSTVDIGVDFRINFLIFEAYSAGPFIQRFGRLGRHAGYPLYRAYGLVPRFILERFHEHLTDTTSVEREGFNQIVHEVFPAEAEFRRYAKRWGVVQAAQVLAELQQQMDENSAFVEALKYRYEHFYGGGDPACPVMNHALKRYFAIKQCRPKVIKELVSFRGQSPLACGVWDATDGHLQTYDLFFLLANTAFSILDEDEFMQEVRRQKLAERDFGQQLLYVKVWEYVAERQRLRLRINCDLAQGGCKLHTVQLLRGISVVDLQQADRDKVNRALKKVSLVSILSDIPPLELKRMMRLGPLFQIHSLEDQYEASYSIAFGQDALLLDSELAIRKTKTNRAHML